MSVNGTLRVELRPSFQLAGLLAVAHVFALVSVWISLAGWPLYLVVAGILISVTACLTETIHRSASAVTALELRTEGRAAWRDRGGNWHEGRLRRDNFVSVPLVVIGLDQSQPSRKWIVLLSDSAPADELRRLRVWLRWGAPGPGKDANRDNAAGQD
ncbi:MAG: protein YgfX [Burkholderiales bacterium]